MNRRSGGCGVSCPIDLWLGVHHLKSFSTSLVTSPTAASQSSKKICMLAVCGLVPMNSGLAPASVLMLRRGATHFALFLPEYYHRLEFQYSLARPPASSCFAFSIFIA